MQRKWIFNSSFFGRFCGKIPFFYDLFPLLFQPNSRFFNFTIRKFYEIWFSGYAGFRSDVIYKFRDGFDFSFRRFFNFLSICDLASFGPCSTPFRMNLHSQDSNRAIRTFKSFLKSELSSAEVETKKGK